MICEIFSMKGKTPFVTYLLEQGYKVLSLRSNNFFNLMITSRFNPGATTKAEPKPAMYHAWLYNNISTMAELAKYTEPDEEVKSSSVWELVEKEQNLR